MVIRYRSPSIVVTMIDWSEWITIRYIEIVSPQNVRFCICLYSVLRKNTLIICIYTHEIPTTKCIYNVYYDWYAENLLKLMFQAFLRTNEITFIIYRAKIKWTVIDFLLFTKLSLF